MSTHKHDHSHHHHGHSHHGHHHHHHHHADGSTGRLGLAFALNFTFAIVELIGGFYTGSVAILSDALHDFGDSLALLFALTLERLSKKKSNSIFSYGYRRYSPLAAVITGLILVLGSLFIFIQAIPRLINPVTPNTTGMFFLALLGLAVNGFAAYRVSKGESLNEKMVMWHLIEDTAGWGLVLVSSVVMHFWDIPQLDAALACVLALWILYNVFGNIKEAFNIFLQAKPEGLDETKLMEEIKKIPLVSDVHHSHIWSLDGQSHVFTTHVVLSDVVTHQQIDEIKNKIKHIAEHYRISESTIEIEFQSTKCVDPEH